MGAQLQKIGIIEYRPTMQESIMISNIGEVSDLNNCAVIREIMNGHWTLDELYSIARKTNPKQYGATLPYLKQAYDPKQSINKIVNDGNKLYSKNILGIDENEDLTAFELNKDK